MDHAITSLLRSSFLPFVAFVCFVVPSAFAQPDPEVERRSFQVAEGFEVTLWAADPMLAKPVQMNFDTGGRLWVATSETYPQLKPGQVADDKVLVLEDTTGAGKADRTTVFARGLLIPTAVLPVGHDGAYVANSTEILHLRDTDGDGKADESKVLLSGFGTEDTHHIIHTFRWGHDGIFYFNQSVYIHSYVETPWGPRKLRAGGTWAFRPETQRLEVFTRGLINHWGHAWDKYGNSFLTDGAGGEGVNYAFPGACFVSLNDPSPRVIKGLNPGSPKYAGAEVISGRHFPDDWQSDLITCDFRANRVVRYKLSDDGAGFSSKLMPDVIKTKDKAFRPVDVKMGPDGALYVADWYNPIINHGEVDFRDPRRDKTHGRIWRVTAKGRPGVERPKIKGQPIGALLELLKSPEDYTRRQARLELRRHDRNAVWEALDRWALALPDDATDPVNEFARLQALWTYQTLDLPSARVLWQCVKAKDPGVRAAAARVRGDWVGRFPPPAGAPPRLGQKVEPAESGEITHLKLLAADTEPRVRLEAVRALANVRTPRAVGVALAVLDKPMDRFLDFALYLTVNELADVWLPEFQAGRLKFDSAKKTEFALKAIRNPAAIKPLVADLKAGKVAVESRKEVAELIAGVGGADDLAALFEVALAPSTGPPTRAALLDALDRAARQRNLRPKADAARLAPHLEKDADPAVFFATVRLAGSWKAKPLQERIRAWAAYPPVPDATRIAAINSLADLGDAESVRAIAAGPGSRAVRVAAVAALVPLDAKAAAKLAIPALNADPNSLIPNPADADPTPLLAAFIKRKDGPKLLGDALRSDPIPADAAKIALRAVYALGSSDPALVQPLQTAAGIGQAKPLTPDELGKLVADVAAAGDLARGEAVFRRADAACLRCHAIGGAGGQLGPDVSSLGSAPVDYLVESILLPAKAVKEGYHSIVVETTDGDVISGIKVRQTDKELVLRDAVQDEIVIPLNTIKGKPREGQSMMPAGLADALTRQELVDLVRFLSELGRPGPYALGTTPVARRWEMLDKDAGGIGPGAPLPDALGPWTAGYARVSGDLPVAADRATLARFRVNVTTPGKVRLILPKGVTAVWVDGQPVAADAALDFTAGVHAITLRAPAGTAALRAEFADVPGSPAQAQFVTGR